MANAHLLEKIALSSFFLAVVLPKTIAALSDLLHSSEVFHISFPDFVDDLLESLFHDSLLSVLD